MADLKSTVESVLSGVKALRHELHRMPELAGEERQTSERIRKELSEIEGIEILPSLLGTDVTALLHGAFPGKTVALRADIDALAIEEKSGVEYASCNPGRMHACGHDGHTAMLVGAAKVLSAHRHELHGTVKFIFQPGEEAKAMGVKLVAAGVLENPRVDIITAMHNWPGMATGEFASRTGAIMASAAHFYITLRGRGGHGSMPETAVDPVVAGAALIQSLQTIVSRNADPQQAAVVSVCHVSTCSKSSNIIPEAIQIDGTTRALSAEMRELIGRRFREIVDGICSAYGVTADFEYHDVYPVTVNAPEAVALAEKVVNSCFGEGHYTHVPKSAMTAEDFAAYLQKVPGVFMRLGAGEEQYPLHHEKFDFNDGALANGITYFAAFALEAGKA